MSSKTFSDIFGSLLQNSELVEFSKNYNNIVKQLTENKGNLSSGSFKADLVEYKDRVVIECDLPGIPKENISIETSKGILTISGKRNPIDVDSTREGDVQLEVYERPCGNFSRDFKFDASVVNFDSTSASIENGVLRVVLPKNEKADERQKINIL